ncbi:MAG: efflux transporter outer membrane subunit [Curvibacter sp.]|nr:efflux transporter outer membrane subunit [Curvibacter sp.]
MSAPAPRPARRGRPLLAALSALLLGACTLGPDFQRPPAPEADHYSADRLATDTVSAAGTSQHLRHGAALPTDWWRGLGSPELDDLVDQALTQNPGLQAAEASLRRSQANLLAGAGVFYPQIGLSAASNRERSAPQANNSTLPSSIFNVSTVGLSVGYALDLFGLQRRTVEGLEAQADEQQALARAARLSLVANVVNTSIARSAYQAQVDTTLALTALQRQQLALTEAQVRAGTTAYASLPGLRSQIAGNEASLEPLRQKRDQAGHLLDSLVSGTPGPQALPLIPLQRYALPGTLPLSLPSELVRQRPDILASEAELHAASAAVGVATASLFPSISLNASYGVAGNAFGNLSGPTQRFWSVGPSVNLPLFQGGSQWYGRQAALAGYEQAQGSYRQTVLNAFAQVADCLSALDHDARALQASEEARAAAREALALSDASYRAGLGAYLDLLAADIQLHQTELAWLQAFALREQDTVALFAALGGGWWHASAAAATASEPSP